MLCLFTNINISYCYVTIYRQQSGLEDNELSLRRCYKAGKSPWQAIDRIVEQCIDSTHQRIVAIIYIVLVWFPTIGRSSFRCFTYSHQPNVGIKGKIGSISFIIEPIATDNADGTWRFFYIFNYLTISHNKSEVLLNLHLFRRMRQDG